MLLSLMKVPQDLVHAFNTSQRTPDETLTQYLRDLVNLSQMYYLMAEPFGSTRTTRNFGQQTISLLTTVTYLFMTQENNLALIIFTFA